MSLANNKDTTAQVTEPEKDPEAQATATESSLPKTQEELDALIEKRLARAVEESMGIENYDYLVVNDDLDECVETVHQMIQSAGWKMTRRMNDVEELRKQISKFSKGE